MEFEKNIWKLLSALHNIWLQRIVIIVSRVNFTRSTYRQQHEFHFANGPEATEEGEQTNKGWGDDQYVDSAWEKICAEELAEEVTVDERDDANHEHA